jgi:tetratricopeptide (TPR) repeat protein
VHRMAASILALSWFVAGAASASPALDACTAATEARATIAACSRYLDQSRADPIPDRIRALETRGHAYDQSGDYDASMADWKEAIRLDPKDDNAMFYLALIYKYNKDDPANAFSTISEAIRLHPSYPYFGFRAGLSMEKGDIDAAIADYDAAVKDAPDNQIVLTERGDAWLKKGDYGRALADYEAALKIAPTYGNAVNGKEAAEAGAVVQEIIAPSGIAGI